MSQASPFTEKNNYIKIKPSVPYSRQYSRQIVRIIICRSRIGQCMRVFIRNLLLKIT